MVTQGAEEKTNIKELNLREFDAGSFICFSEKISQTNGHKNIQFTFFVDFFCDLPVCFPTTLYQIRGWKMDE